MEVLALGPRGDLESLLDDLRRGPSEAEVSSVDAPGRRPMIRRCHGFEIRWD